MENKSRGIIAPVGTVSGEAACGVLSSNPRQLRNSCRNPIGTQYDVHGAFRVVLACALNQAVEFALIRLCVDLY